MERGVVLSPKFVELPTGSVRFESAVDEFELRKYLTYWDKIDVPRSSMVEFDCWQLTFLEHAGFLKRTRYGRPQSSVGAFLRGSFDIDIQHCKSARIIDCKDITIHKDCGDQILLAHEDVFMQNASKEPGVWSKAQVSTSLKSSGSCSREAIEMELYNLLPVPAVGTTLEDIIKFKETRHDELIKFRCYLDDIYQSVLVAGDIPRAKSTALNRLEQSLIDIQRTMKESKIEYFLDSLRSVVADTSGIGGLALGGAGVASILSMDPYVAAAASAGIGIASKFIPQRKDSLPNELTYLKSVRRSFCE
ncbi:DUF6236 family protein [Vibrio alginolyticus]|uniref:DUF6236 family protein n=1 Tax=Vibrio alginolyticus TaxID=663 RepID=UPI003754AAF2